MAEPERRGRPTFLPVVLVGIASAGACAVVGHQPWAHVVGRRAETGSALTLATEAGRVPGCTGLALVLLACWGVVLVTRGRVRRVVAALGLLAAVGVLAAVVAGFGSAAGDVRGAYAQYGITDVEVSRDAWSLVAFPAALVALAAAVAAVWLVSSWPEMGRRYDAPAGAATPREVPVGEHQDDVALWKAITEGRDPTAGPPA